MNYEIRKQDWAVFFETLSRRRYEWKTKIEVLNTDIGDQILTEGLRLNGITCETRGDRTSLSLSLGENTASHQTHTISDPTKVIVSEADADQGDVIDIEEADGTKTLITFIEPMSLYFEHVEVDIAAAAM